MTFDKLAIFLTDMALGLIRKFPWLTSKENRKRLEDQQKENYAKGAQTDKEMARTRMRTDLYNTSIRYNGTQGYGTVLDKDVLSKEQKKKTATGEELKKLTAELDNLKARQEMLKNDFGYKPTPPVPGAKLTASLPGASPAVPVTKETAAAAGAAATKFQQAATATTKVATTQVENAAKLGTAGAQQVAATQKITQGWNTVTVTSQQKLLNSASSLAAAIGAAAAKLKVTTPTTPTGPAGDGKPGNGPPVKTNYAGNMTTSLGRAIATEKKNMPSGANIVIANDSETIIPAKTAATGMNLGGMAASLDKFTAGANALSQLASQSGLFGAGGGDIIAVGKMLLGMGLQVGMNPYFQYGKGFLPGGGGYIGKHAPDSYHYKGRALDVSGSDAQLDAAYAKLKSTAYKELLWRTAGHYDHLHVAYANGFNNPTLLGTEGKARSYEAANMPFGAKVRSITSNTSEMFGSGMTINAPITIHQQPGQNSEALAIAVARRLGDAIQKVRDSSVLV
jgi:hypothetical protein